MLQKCCNYDFHRMYRKSYRVFRNDELAVAENNLKSMVNEGFRNKHYQMQKLIAFISGRHKSVARLITEPINHLSIK